MLSGEVDIEGQREIAALHSAVDSCYSWDIDDMPCNHGLPPWLRRSAEGLYRSSD